MVEERFFETREALITDITNKCAQLLLAEVVEYGSAVLMASGGSSPEPLYRELSQRNLPWQNITVGLVDERWVSPEHSASNQRFLKTIFLQNRAAKATLLPMKNCAATAKLGMPECERVYNQAGNFMTVTILGMGGDGHTASLFPYADGLNVALDSDVNLCAAITAIESDVTGENIERMTLTLHGITNTKTLFLMIMGNEKLAVYKQAMAGNDVLEMPVRAVLKQNKIPVIVYWAP
jgi:6-phosphogluconolactonase